MKSYFLFALILLILFHPIFTKSNDSILYLRTADATTLDPGKVFSIYSADVVSNIFEGLVEYKKDTREIIPCLATKWKSFENGRIWVFTLRKNVLFHDGTKFDSSAVLYSFKSRQEKMEKEYHEWKLLFPNIISITTPDKFTIKITLKKPYAPFLTLLTYSIAYIVPEGSYKNIDFSPIGTGPFKFEKWEKGKYIAMTRNENYWNGIPIIKKVIFKVNSKPINAINMIKSGQADVMEIKSLELYQNFLGPKKFKITQSTPGGIFFLIFNTKKYPFNNSLFRKGFAHLINKDIMIKTIFQNFVPPAKTPFPYTFTELDKKIKDYLFSMEKAKSLFRETGIIKTFKCSISYLENNKSERLMVEVFRRQAEKAGIVLLKDPLPLNLLYKKLTAGMFDIALRGWFSGPDPDLYFFANFTNIKGNANFGRYLNPELIKLLYKARETLNQKERKKLYLKVQNIIHEEAPWIPLYYPRATIVHSKRIKNICFNSNSLIIFKKAYIKEQ